MLRLALALCLGAFGASAQEPVPLADMRKSVDGLYDQLDDLRALLGPARAAPLPRWGGNSPLERLGSIEGELRRITAKIEELEYRVDRMVRDGTARIGDLDYRLCVLETGCSPGQLSVAQPLGGTEAASTGPVAVIARPNTPVAAGARAMFDGAQAAFEAGEFETAAKGFADHLAAFPSGPLTAQAELMRGKSRERLADLPGAARAYLSAFSAVNDGPHAAEALTELGRALGALGQVNEACVTLSEVATRFPQSAFVPDAAAARQQLSCP